MLSLLRQTSGVAAPRVPDPAAAAAAAIPSTSSPAPRFPPPPFPAASAAGVGLELSGPHTPPFSPPPSPPPEPSSSSSLPLPPLWGPEDDAREQEELRQQARFPGEDPGSSELSALWTTLRIRLPAWTITQEQYIELKKEPSLIYNKILQRKDKLKSSVKTAPETQASSGNTPPETQATSGKTPRSSSRKPYPGASSGELYPGATSGSHTPPFSPLPEPSSSSSSASPPPLPRPFSSSSSSSSPLPSESLYKLVLSPTLSLARISHMVRQAEGKLKKIKSIQIPDPKPQITLNDFFKEGDQNFKYQYENAFLFLELVLNENKLKLPKNPTEIREVLTTDTVVARIVDLFIQNWNRYSPPFPIEAFKWQAIRLAEKQQEAEESGLRA